MHRMLGLLIGLATIPSLGLAQRLLAANVPPVVRQACEAKFSVVRKVEWKLKSDHEAEFKRNGVEVAARFDANGNLRSAFNSRAGERSVGSSCANEIKQ